MWLWWSKPFWDEPFWLDCVNSPPIVGFILVGIGRFTGGTIWILTHGHVTGNFDEVDFLAIAKKAPLPVQGNVDPGLINPGLGVSSLLEGNTSILIQGFIDPTST